MSPKPERERSPLNLALGVMRAHRSLGKRPMSHVLTAMSVLLRWHASRDSGSVPAQEFSQSGKDPLWLSPQGKTFNRRLPRLRRGVEKAVTFPYFIL